MSTEREADGAAASDLREELEFEQARFEALASIVDEVVYQMDARGVIHYLNARAFEISGYGPEDLQAGFDATQLVVEEDRPRARANLVHLMQQGGTPGVHEYTVRRKDGSTFPGVTRTAILTRGERPAGVLGTIRDVSARRQAERLALASEQRFQSVFHAIPDGIAITTLQGHIVDVNEAFTAISGYARDEILGRSVLELGLYVDPEARMRGAAQVLRTGQAMDDEIQLRHRDGSIHDALLSVRVIEFDGVPHFLTVGRDITELKRAAREREQFEARVQQAQRLESLGVLAGGIAHDFNNLLMGILGHADVGLAETAPGSEAATRLEQIREVAHRAADLTGQLLAYSGRGRFMVEPVDLSALTRELRTLLAMSVSKQAELNFELVDDLPAVQAERAQLQQVLMNLILNASEALGQGRGQIWVRTGVEDRSAKSLLGLPPHEPRPSGRYTFVEVCDDGCGVSDAVRARMFEPFFSTKFPGRGLGLAALLGIVRGHHGAVEVKPRHPRGTCLRVLLPASASTVAPPLPRPVADTSWRGHGCVLLIDDDPDVRQVGELMLRRLGFEVLLAADGYQGCELLAEHLAEVRCVVLDLIMPGIDGVETLARLRRLRAEVPVILSSGYTEQDAVQRFSQVELVGFVQKPYGTDALRALLRRALGE